MLEPIDIDTFHVRRPSTDELCKDLLQALHSASQPLTILRASLDLPNIQTRSVEELRRLLKQTNQEVERLCLFFSYIQQFVLIGSIDAEMTIESLPRLLTHTVEGVHLLFEEAGISLKVEDAATASLLILLDVSRFEQALSAILLVVLGMAVRGDVVTVTSPSPGKILQIVLPPTSLNTMTSQTRLSLALAATNLRSQGAGLMWQEHPFTAQIALPVTGSPVLP